MSERVVRWMDRALDSIPLMITLVGMLVGAIAWFIRLENKVNQNYDHMQAWQGSSENNKAARNTEMESVRTRLTVLETVNRCRESSSAGR